MTAAAPAAPPLYTIVSDALDANAPAAALPAGPVEQALAELEREQPAARVVVSLRVGEANGLRYALAAWQSSPRAVEWDSILVVTTAAGARTLEISSSSKDRDAALAALVDHGTRTAPVVPAVAPRAVAPAMAAMPAPVPMPNAWDQRFVVLYARDPAYRPGDAAAETALTEQHIQYTLRLQQDGTALAAGRFEGGAEDDAPIGMTLLRVRDLAAAERIAAADPAVVAGRLTASVREWTVPAGKLP